MKKVLIFSITYFPFVGGAEVAIKEITDRISDCEFDLITAKFDKKLPSQEKIGNINVTRVGSGGLLDKYLFAFRAVKKANKLNKNYDIVWAMMANYAGLAALLYKLKNTHTKYLLTLQSGDTEKFMWKRTWFWYLLYKKVYTKADRIQSISNYLEKRARKYGYKGKVDIIPNGVDLDVFTQEFSSEHKQKLKESLEIKPKEKIIITISRLVEKNAISDLIRAVKNLNVRLLIVGIGKLETKLKALSHEIGNHNKVVFLGQLDHKDIPQYLAISDIFIRPSISEGLGNSFLEAMAAKVPVIATPVGGIPDFLDERKTGLFCEVKNPSSIAEKINLLLSDENLRKEIVNNGHQLVISQYSWENIASKMNEIFNTI
ncbi:glycosyltransferase family 4 protein [Patescibacteria group bacterium]|nr:glycosyltransferase family 4 protein [Patescibacteria group bacterium]